MIMKYEPVPGFKPRERGRRIKSLTGGVADVAMSRRGSTASDSSWTRNYASGSSQGADSLPTQAAPLVYMDDRRDHRQFLSASPVSSAKSASSREEAEPSTSAKQLGKKAQGAFDSLNHFLDKRARARYVSENGDDILAVPGTSQSTGSAFLDVIGNRRSRRPRGRLDGSDQEQRDEWYKYQEERAKIVSARRGRRETEERLRELDERFHEKMEEIEGRRVESEGKQRNISQVRSLYLLLTCPRHTRIAVSLPSADAPVISPGYPLSDDCESAV